MIVFENYYTTFGTFCERCLTANVDKRKDINAIIYNLNVNQLVKAKDERWTRPLVGSQVKSPSTAATRLLKKYASKNTFICYRKLCKINLITEIKSKEKSIWIFWPINYFFFNDYSDYACEHNLNSKLDTKETHSAILDRKIEIVVPVAKFHNGGRFYHSMVRGHPHWSMVSLDQMRRRWLLVVYFKADFKVDSFGLFSLLFPFLLLLYF